MVSTLETLVTEPGITEPLDPNKFLFHPATRKMRPMDKDEKARLRADIWDVGIKTPIVICQIDGKDDWQIVDGVARYEIWREMMLDGNEIPLPIAELPDGITPEEFIARNNVNRRHLTKQEIVIAMWDAEQALRSDRQASGVGITRKEIRDHRALYPKVYSESVITQIKAILSSGTVLAQALRDGWSYVHLYDTHSAYGTYPELVEAAWDAWEPDLSGGDNLVTTATKIYQLWLEDDEFNDDDEEDEMDGYDANFAAKDPVDQVDELLAEQYAAELIAEWEDMLKQTTPGSAAETVLRNNIARKTGQPTDSWNGTGPETSEEPEEPETQQQETPPQDHQKNVDDVTGGEPVNPDPEETAEEKLARETEETYLKILHRMKGHVDNRKKARELIRDNFLLKAINAEIGTAKQIVNKNLEDRAPKGWDDLIDNERMFGDTEAKPPAANAQNAVAELLFADWDNPDTLDKLFAKIQREGPKFTKKLRESKK